MALSQRDNLNNFKNHNAHESWPLRGPNILGIVFKYAQRDLD